MRDCKIEVYPKASKLYEQQFWGELWCS